MQYFEKDLLDMFKSLKFRNVQDNFQTKMKHDILKIKLSANVFVFADKAANLYEIAPNDCKRLLDENITKIYKKSTKLLENAINMEAKHMAENSELYDRIESLAQTPAFVTLNPIQDGLFPGCSLWGGGWWAFPAPCLKSPTYILK